ncbi:hypothetical protein [Komagataeibacter rhaeticus]|uniref:hypothetical protein n=1 Tax=Komagataeibacter rhaeticus TaxID=215221 RepID=UPI001CD2EE2D|nr:hypothetical protein [Komagataeibacter rhaeticus]
MEKPIDQEQPDRLPVPEVHIGNVSMQEPSPAEQIILLVPVEHRISEGIDPQGGGKPEQEKGRQGKLEERFQLYHF